MVSDISGLSGRTAVVAAADPFFATVIATLLSAAGCLAAIVCPDPATVRRLNEQASGAVGFAADPTDRSAWERILPHVEQRLGPIDAVIAAAGDNAESLLVELVGSDLAARRGVLVTVGESGTAVPEGVRRVCLPAGADPAGDARAALAAIAAVEA